MKIESIFKALGSTRRIRILKILLKSDKLSVGEISQKIDLSLKSTSKHLLLLEKLDLVKREQKSRWGFYSYSTKASVDRIKKILELAELLVR
ncbi:MAG: helix-turn-helix transcriptional regulator [Candidatus Omnitrophica bacterium]|nr:helix-turn-helix transcriptional regulator [Candidatus Omnitrophota bacterium]